MCHICANRAHEGTDGIAIAQAQRRAESSTPPSPRIAPTPEQKPHFLENEKTRGILILGGLAAATITLGLIFPVEEYIADFFAASPTELPKASSRALSIVMIFVVFFLETFSYFIRIYVGLVMCDKLLNEEFHLNLIQVGGMALLFYGAGLAAILPFPFIGIFIFIVQMWLIWQIYDIDLEKFLFFIFIYVVGGALLGPALYGVEQLIYALMGKIFL